MKDVTSTSFGLLIAHVLPGLAGLYGIAFWSSDTRTMLNTFLTSQSNIGLFFLVFGAAIIIGLEFSLARWLIFEKLVCRSKHLDPKEFATIGIDEKKLTAFRAVADEHYRYHQFWGGICIAMPIIFIGWLTDSWSTLGYWRIIGSIVVFVVVEAFTMCGAIVAFRKYIERGKAILKGD
jgi:hypothetical protein